MTGVLRSRIASLRGRRRLLVAALAGALMALAQPPVSWPVVLFVALPVLMWLVDGTAGLGAAFRVGWAAGAGHFAAALFWIVSPFMVQPEVFGWMAPFALAGMAGGLALFWGVAFALTRRWWRPGVWRVLALAAFWTLAEYARSHVLTGFPWGLVAYAWVETPVMQAAALVGPHGLGLVTLVAGLLPAVGGWRPVAVAAALVAAGLGWGAWRLAQPLPERAAPVLVRLVQPDADQALKWDPEMAAVFRARLLTFSAEPADPAPDVTIWPETAVPWILRHAPEEQAEAAASVGPEGRLILGVMRLDRTAEADFWFNSLAVLAPDGAIEAVYDKHHLVPFGEYIPQARRIAKLGLPGLETMTGGGFTPGPGPRLISVPGLPPFLPLICYEAIFPHGLRAPEGRPEWLVQVTNDAWFGTVSGPYQHLAQARARAIEQGLPLARVANTGISAMVDPKGRVIARIGLGDAGYLDVTLPAALSPTLYAVYGDVPLLVMIATILGLTLINFYGGIFAIARR